MCLRREAGYRNSPAGLRDEIERLNLDLAQGKFREGATCCYCSHSGAKMLAEIECLRANERRLVCDLARAIKDLAAAKAAKGE
jgi:hypothetical protein